MKRCPYFSFKPINLRLYIKYRRIVPSRNENNMTNPEKNTLFDWLPGILFYPPCMQENLNWIMYEVHPLQIVLDNK